MDADQSREVYKRSCQLHLQKKANPHLAWSAFEEKQGMIKRYAGDTGDSSLPSTALINTITPRLPSVITVIRSDSKCGVGSRKRAVPQTG